MEIFVLDENFKSLYNLDAFESLIWTERYNGAGNFEFYTPVNEKILQVVNTIQEKMEADLDTYAWLKSSKTHMVIEDLELTTDSETGDHLIVSGRGPESLLERRIIWDQTTLNGKLQNGVKTLVNNAIISPKIAARKIPNFKFITSTQKDITDLTIRAQYTGDNLYDTVLTICNDRGIGFDVTVNNSGQFEFLLYSGIDRSYDQNVNPYVVFSPKFENIINSDYLESAKTLKNVTLVAGEDEGSNRKTRIVGSASGLARRELYTDARDIQSEVDGEQLSETEYNELLDERGSEKLSEHKYTKVFTGEVEATKTFVYGVDFFKGDIVQIVNEYGMKAKVRVSEVVRVQDATGYRMYPTFQVLS